MNEDDKNQAQPGEQVEDTGNVQPPDTSENIVVRQGGSGGVAAAPTPTDAGAEQEVPAQDGGVPAYTEPDEEAASVDSEANIESDTTYAASPAASETVPQPAAPTNSKKRVLIAVVAAVVVIVAGLVTWWVMSSNDTTDTQDNSAVSTETQKLGVAVTVADGTVEYGRDDAWKELTTDSDVQLAEGDLVRTGADSRAVLTLDDGSAVRLDEQTEVKLASLAANNVQIDHTKGAVYSRVVPSERKYTVNVDEVSYESLGTAFVTINDTKTKGLQVFQSSVKASGLEDAVAEGKQYFVANANSALMGKVTGIELAKLVSNSFVAWNVAEDKKDGKFKDKLGVLGAYDKAVADDKAKRKAEAEAKAKAEAEAKATAEKARLEAERKAREAATPAPSGGMSVKLSDGGIFWTYAGTAEKGFKVVYSATNTTPSFGQSGSTSVYVSEPRAQFLGIPKEMKSGKTYYVRVCVYQPDNSSQPCKDYSNVLRIN